MPADSTKNPNELTFLGHLDELRSRMVWSMLLWFAVFIACFVFSKPIFSFLAQPFYNATGLQFGVIEASEPFMAHLRASFWSSIFLSSGIFFYHLWGFVSPGLMPKEKRFAAPFLVFMALFFIGGCFFSFTQVFPKALKFLLTWHEGDQSNITRTSYINDMFIFVFGMGLCFQLPLVIFLLAKVRLVTPKFLLEKFKYAVLIIFIVAAIITPTPDMVTQSLLALPMIVLYFLGVGAAFLVRRKDGDIDEIEDEDENDIALPEPEVEQLMEPSDEE